LLPGLLLLLLLLLLRCRRRRQPLLLLPSTWRCEVYCQKQQRIAKDCKGYLQARVSRKGKRGCAGQEALFLRSAARLVGLARSAKTSRKIR
jgi:hypothetical protein